MHEFWPLKLRGRCISDNRYDQAFESIKKIERNLGTEVDYFKFLGFYPRNFLTTSKLFPDNEEIKDSLSAIVFKYEIIELRLFFKTLPKKVESEVVKAVDGLLERAYKEEAELIYATMEICKILYSCKELGYAEKYDSAMNWWFSVECSCIRNEIEERYCLMQKASEMSNREIQRLSRLFAEYLIPKSRKNNPKIHKTPKKLKQLWDVAGEIATEMLKKNTREAILLVASGLLKQHDTNYWVDTPIILDKKKTQELRQTLERIKRSLIRVGNSLRYNRG